MTERAAVCLGLPTVLDVFAAVLRDYLGSEVSANDRTRIIEAAAMRLAPGTGEPGLDVPRQWSEGWEPRCDDDFYCGECPDCLSGEHPENRPPTP